MKILIGLYGSTDEICEIPVPKQYFNENDNAECNFYEELIDNHMSEIIDDALAEWFSDIFYDIIGEIQLPLASRYYVCETLDKILSFGMKLFRNKYPNAILLFRIVSDEEKELYKTGKKLEEYFNTYLDRREVSEQGNIDAGYVIRNNIQRFITLSSWKYGLLDKENHIIPYVEWPEPLFIDGEWHWTRGHHNYKPIMWFGLENELPSQGWILNDGEDWKEFWFCNEAWDDWVNRIPDADDDFLTWNIIECGDELPDLREVLKTCPIDISENDEIDLLTRKITNYICGQTRPKKLL